MVIPPEQPLNSEARPFALSRNTFHSGPATRSKHKRVAIASPSCSPAAATKPLPDAGQPSKAPPSVPAPSPPVEGEPTGPSHEPSEQPETPASPHGAKTRHFRPLVIHGTAPPQDTKASDAEPAEVLELASMCLETLGAAVLALPGPASDRRSWVKFAQGLKRSHALALKQALEFFHER